MELMLTNPFAYLDTFMLIFVRVGSLFILVPFLGNRSIPIIAKIAMAFFISAIIINVMNVQTSISSSEPYLFALAMLKESFVGWMIGFAAYLVYTTLTLAGQFIDHQIGFSMVNVFDPLSQIQLSITGTLYYYLVLLLTLITNTYHYFIRGIIKSFDLIPIGSGTISTQLYNGMLGFINETFVIALQIAAPFFFVIMVMDMVLALLARTAPQLNLFVIGFPLKIFLGIVVMLITINVFPTVAELITEKSLYFIDQIIKGMMP